MNLENRSTPFKDISGGESPEKRAEILDAANSSYINFEGSAHISEIDHPEGFDEIVEAIQNDFEKFVINHGGIPVNILLKNIHFMTEKDFDQCFKKDSKTPQLSTIGHIFIRGNNKDIHSIMSDFVHELFHISSYHKLQVAPAPLIFTSTRSGLLATPHKRSDRLFDNLNEAITDTLALRFEQMFFRTHPTLKKYTDKKEQFQNQNPKDEFDVYKTVRYQDNASIYTWRRQYTQEKRKLYEICETIAQKKKDTYLSANDVFLEFTRGYFNGDMSVIAKLIDDTYGKGSFRALAIDLKNFPPKKEIT